MASIHDSLEQKARAALTHPPDSAFWDNDLFHTHGFSGFTQSRDSGILEKSNYRVAFKLLKEKFHGSECTEGPTCHAFGNDGVCEHDRDDVYDISVSHWAVGWAEMVIVRVVIDPTLPEDELFDEDNIHPAFKEAMELLETVTLQYPVLDDMDMSELEWEESCENVKNEAPSWAQPTEGHDWGEVVGWMHDNDIYGGDDNTWFSEDEIAQACWDLGFIDPRPGYWEDAIEWLESKEEMLDEYLRDVEQYVRDHRKWKLKNYELPMED